LTGSWNLFGVSATVSMVRGLPPRIPYTRETVTCHNGDVMLAGTLLVPSGNGPHPAVVFVHGSGSETRDASSFLADYLTREGLASLTFDKRGAGASSGDWREADFNDLAKDVLACVEVLKTRRDINRNKIGLAGASQARWVAPLAASRSGFSLASPRAGIHRGANRLDKGDGQEGMSTSACGISLTARENLRVRAAFGQPLARPR
jgi:dienelactone hydrolase